MHESFIRHSIELARQAIDHGNNPFGACLVKDGEILLEAENAVNTDHDPTSHAETNLVRKAAKTLDGKTISECVLYTSNEPCAMCAAAIYWAGVRTVVFGCSNVTLEKYAGKSIDMSCRDIYQHVAHPVEVVGPLLEEEAATVHQNFWSGADR